MRLAISNIAWLPGENAAALEALRQAGVEALEAAPTLLFSDPLAVSEAQALARRRELEQAGVRVVAFQALLFGRPELQVFDPATHPALLDVLARLSALAGALGAGPLVFGSPKNRLRKDLPFAEALARAADLFRRAAETAAAHGAALCIEPNASDYGCDFVTDTAEALALTAAVDHPGFGLHLDAGVLTMNQEDAAAALATAVPGLRHFHASEPFLARLGDGTTDHRGLGRLLRDLDYQGFVSIEMRSDPAGGNVEHVARCLRLAREAYLADQ
jgi:sugar phosphate isomerase/epimerase